MNTTQIYFATTEHYGLRYGRRGTTTSIRLEEIETGKTLVTYDRRQTTEAREALDRFEAAHDARMKAKAEEAAKREVKLAAEMITEATKPATVTESGEDKITARQLDLYRRLLSEERHLGCWLEIPTGAAIEGLSKRAASQYISAMLEN